MYDGICGKTCQIIVLFIMLQNKQIKIPIPSMDSFYFYMPLATSRKGPRMHNPTTYTISCSKYKH